MKDQKSLSRYNTSFKFFWAFCHIKGIDTQSATMSEVAGLLLQFDKVMSSHARFAYSSLLLISGLEQLTFNPMLRQIKRKWNDSQARYASFYDASDPIKKLAAGKLNWQSIEQVRLRLLLCCRFLMLCRNIDLAQMYRTISTVNGKPFVLIQRKGWKKSQWEALFDNFLLSRNMSLDFAKTLCQINRIKTGILWFPSVQSLVSPL